jgi:hypothetical protein
MSVNLCDLGEVTQSKTVDGYTLEAKSYPREAARQLLKNEFAKTQILRGNNLDGEVPITGNDDSPVVTVHEDVKTRLRLFVEEYKAHAISDANSTYSNKSCGWHGGATRKVLDYDVYLHVKAVKMEEDFCFRQYIETWRTSAVARRMSDETRMATPISDYMQYEFLKTARLMVDKHAWNGDYKSADENTTHVDGFIKLAVNGLATGVSGIWEYVVTESGAGMTAAHAFVVAIGGLVIVEPFDTDVSTTLDNLIATLATANLKDPITGLDLFTSITKPGTNDRLRIAQRAKGEHLLVKMNVVDVTGVPTYRFCEDSTNGLVSTKEVTTVVVTQTVVTAPIGADNPIAIPITAIHKGNVVERFELLWSVISDTRPEMLETDFGATWYVAPNVFNALTLADRSALHNQFGACDRNGNKPSCTTWMNQRINKMNYMRKDMVFIAPPRALHFGTNLIDEFQALETGYKEKEQNYWMRQEFRMGFQIARMSDIAGTLEDPTNSYFNFQTAMPTAP